MCRAYSSSLGNLNSMSPGAPAAWFSQVCGSADFPRRTIRGVACGWPTVSAWTPAARACGTLPLSTSTSAPNISRRTALSWWESGGLPCQPALGQGVGCQSSRQQDSSVLKRQSLSSSHEDSLPGGQADMIPRVFPLSLLCTIKPTSRITLPVTPEKNSCFRECRHRGLPASPQIKILFGLSTHPCWWSFFAHLSF